MHIHVFVLLKNLCIHTHIHTLYLFFPQMYSPQIVANIYADYIYDIYTYIFKYIYIYIYVCTYIYTYLDTTADESSAGDYSVVAGGWRRGGWVECHGRRAICSCVSGVKFAQ